ncbi:MAG: histidine kinase [Cyanobacteria bacterium P01_A01_bin.40]
MAKACFLLNRRDAIITIILIAISNLIIYAQIVPKFQAEAKEYIPLNGTEELFDSLAEELLDFVIDYITVSFFLTLLMFLLVAESKSRQRSEKLAKKVEVLATVVERNRIVRDIHDSLGHTLTTLGIQLELAKNYTASVLIELPKLCKMISNWQISLYKMLAHTITAIRDRDFNLEQALKALILQFSRDNLFEVKTAVRLPNIPFQTSHQVYYLVKEALYNIQKHS